MAKRTKKTENTQEQDNREFFLALDQLERERGIKKEYMIEKITQALATAYKRDHEGVGDNLAVIADEEHNIVRMVIRRDVVEEVDNPYTEISLEDARRSLPHVQLGDVVSQRDPHQEFRPHRRPDRPSGHHPGHPGGGAQQGVRRLHR